MTDDVNATAQGVQWGEAIPVDGKRPEWLRDDERCMAAFGGELTWYRTLYT